MLQGRVRRVFFGGLWVRFPEEWEWELELELWDEEEERGEVVRCRVDWDARTERLSTADRRGVCGALARRSAERIRDIDRDIFVSFVCGWKE